jgi:hypothetical protein
MTSARRALLVGLVALAAGYATSRFFYASERHPDAPVIDLDNLPPVEVPATTVAPGNGATIVPPPTVAPPPTAPAPTSPPAPAPTNPPPPPPPPPDDDDDGDDDDGDDDDDDDDEFDD